MTYQQFQDEILTKTKESFDSDTIITIQSVPKNNGIQLDGLTIMENDCNISPTIYLNPLYDEYTNGSSIEHILTAILSLYLQNKPNDSIDIHFYTDFSNVKDRICFKLVNYEKNEALLLEIPHFRYLDLAVVFYCLVSTTPSGSATILVHNRHLSFWNIQKEELYQFALSNTPSSLPYSLLSLSEVLQELFADDTPDAPPIESCVSDSCDMYVLTNTMKLYGASCLLYPQLLQELALRFKSDLYILPSSVHEVLLLPAAPSLTPEELTAMVCEVNASQVSDDEILSDHVYFYSLEKECFCL